MGKGIVWMVCAMMLLAQPPSDTLKVVGFKDTGQGRGVVILTGALSRQYFPDKRKGTARLEVKVNPPNSGVFPETADYMIENGQLTAQVLYQRPATSKVSFELTLLVPDKNGSPKPLTAKDSLAPYRGTQFPRSPLTPPSPTKQGDQESTPPQQGIEGPPKSTPPQEGVLKASLQGVRIAENACFSLMLSGPRPPTIDVVIRDANTSNELFRKTVSLPPGDKPVEFEAPFLPDSLLTLDDRGHQVLSVPVRAKRPPQPLPPLFLLLTYFDSALLALGFLVGGAVLTWRWFNPTSSKVVDDLASIRLSAEEALGYSKKSYDLIVATKAGSDAGNDLDGRIAGLENSVTLLSAQLGSQEELRAISGLLPGSADKQPSQSDLSFEEQALLATANYWLESGLSRSELPLLAGKLGISASLYTHKNVAKTLADITSFTYEFERSDREGGWLWVSLPGGNGALAVPADVAFFQIFKAVDLLDRLFEGTQNASGQFRFGRFYRACHLRSSGRPEGYNLVSKGLLWLEGDPTPNLSVPPSYASLLHHDQPAHEPVSSLAGALAVQLLSIARDVREADAKIREVCSALSALEGKMESLFGKLGQILDSQQSLHEAAKREWDPEFDQLKLSLELTKKGEPVGAQRRVEATMVTAPPKESILKELPPVAPTGLEEVPWRMPENWQEAVRSAGPPPGSEVGTEERTPPTYLRRLEALRDALNRTKPTPSARIAHLRLDGDICYVHDTEAIPGGSDELLCCVCEKSYSSQLAVCIGSSGQGTIGVLYPLGRVVTSDYPAAYTRLIEDMPAFPFVVADIRRPAILEKINSGYSVKQKLQWSPPTDQINRASV